MTVHLDGTAYEARPNESILDLARRVGLGERIPTLCYDPRLPPNGSCFVCIVEVEGVPRLLPACATPVSDGMKVSLKNDRVTKARQTALNLLLSNHDADCEGPCRTGCPAGIDIQGYLRLVADERFEEAWRLIRERNPLVAICGRVCVRKCEEVCRRQLLEGPVGINHLKRVAADWYRDNPVADLPGDENGHKVAVVGAGPGGLTAAYYLRKQGTAVTIFEALPESGGWLRYGIPAYRLPRDVLDHEVKTITDMGVEIRYGVTVGKDISLDELKEQGYEALFLATGATRSRKMRVKGEEGPGVLHGIDVLRDFGLGHTPDFEGKKVLIVGGGNTAIDVARTAVRLNAAETRMIYRRTRAEMPAHGEEIDAALEEGTIIDYLVAPTRCLHEGDKLVGIECVKMELGEPDASGRRRPVPVEGSEHVVSCDWAVAAIGQSTDLAGLVDGDGLPDADRWGCFAVDQHTYATTVPGIFAAGDAATGPMAVIDAIGAARKAAYSIQRYLEVGEAAAPPHRFTSERFGDVTRESLGDIAETPREHPPMMPPEERTDFSEVEHVFRQEQAVHEAARCLQCGCAAIEDCDLRRFATEYDADPTGFKGDSPRRRVDERHPWITIDPNKCILCGRCVRTCGEVIGVSALGLIGRGFETVVAPAMNKPLLEAGCVSCGSCVEACPTGALVFSGTDSGRWEPTETAATTCGYCGVGCDVEVHLHGRETTVRSRRYEDGTFSDLCARGRFGPQAVRANERLTQPLIRRDGELVPTGWDEAIAAAAAGLKGVRDRHGAGAVAVTVSPRATCEDGYAARLLGREALGTDNVGSVELASHRAAPRELEHVLGSSLSTVSATELSDADVILLSGSDPSELCPVAALEIRRAVKRGTKLVVVGTDHTPLIDLATIWLDVRRGSSALALAGIAAQVAETSGWPELTGAEELRNALAMVTPESLAGTAGISSDDVAAAARLLCAEGTKVTAIADLDDPLERATDPLLALGNLLLLLEHAHGAAPGRLFLTAHANAVGVRAVGIDGELALKRALAAGALRGAWLVGEDPANALNLPTEARNPEFLVVMDHVLTETARAADVVFPLASHVERGGTFVSADATVKSLATLVVPGGPRPASNVLLAAARALGLDEAPEPAALAERVREVLGADAGERMTIEGAPRTFTVPSLASRPTHPAPPTVLNMERRAGDHILMTLGRTGPRV